MLKNAMSTWVFDDNGVGYRFISTPNKEEMDAAFTELKNWVQNGVIYFSDDAVYKVTCRDGPKYFNVDISSCDISNTQKIFDALIYMSSECMVMSEHIQKCVEQCGRGCKIIRTSGVEAIFRTSRCLEYSGTVLTTSLNNVAMVCIGYSVYDIFLNIYRSNLYTQDVKMCIEGAANLVGYNVTVEICECHEDIQFLKFSFTDDARGGLISFLNLGVVLRAVGRMKQRVAQTRKKVEKHHLGVLRGLDGVQPNPLTGNVSPGESDVELPYLLQGLAQRQRVCLQAYCARYKFESGPLLEAARLFQKSGYGIFVYHPVFDQILGRDYGM